MKFWTKVLAVGVDANLDLNRACWGKWFFETSLLSKLIYPMTAGKLHAEANHPGKSLGDISNRPDVRHEKCIEALREPVALQSQFPCREIESGIQQSGTSSTFLPSSSTIKCSSFACSSPFPRWPTTANATNRGCWAGSLCADFKRTPWRKSGANFTANGFLEMGYILQNRRWALTLQRHKITRY